MRDLKAIDEIRGALELAVGQALDQAVLDSMKVPPTPEHLTRRLRERWWELNELHEVLYAAERAFSLPDHWVVNNKTGEAILEGFAALAILGQGIQVEKESDRDAN